MDHEPKLRIESILTLPQGRYAHQLWESRK